MNPRIVGCERANARSHPTILEPSKVNPNEPIFVYIKGFPFMIIILGSRFQYKIVLTGELSFQDYFIYLTQSTKARNLVTTQPSWAATKSLPIPVLLKGLCP